MTLTLRVRAIDEAGAPVAGAVLRRDDEVVATTDADGVAIVDGINTGFASVSVSYPMPAEVQLVFSLGEGSSGIIDRTVTLRRGAALSGTVVRPDGSPLPDAVVEVWSASGRTRFLESDAEGNWSVLAMQAGAYEVRAGAQGYARGRAIAGTHDGRTEEHGVVVRVAIGARLRGRVQDASAQPVVGANVYTEMQPGDDRSATTDNDGRFEIVGLGAGRHYVGVGGWRSSVVMPGDGEQRELDIQLPEPVPTLGPAPARSRQDDEPTAPMPTATLTGRVLRDGAPVSHFAIVRKGTAAYNWISQPAMIHAADGRFTLPELHESSCSVHVLAFGSMWTSTATVQLEPGSTLDLGDIELQRGLRIAGTVCSETGEPIDGAYVEIGGPLRDDDALHDAVEGNFATTTGADGTFVFEGVHLRNGRVRISACHPLHGSALQQLLGGTNETLRVVLVPTGAIDGEIVPYSVMNSCLIVRADAPEGGSHVVSVRPSGLFTVENLVPDDYTIELVERPGWPRREVRATVVAGERIHVRMPPP